MAFYITKPITEKFSVDDQNDRISYGASSMQGWRRYQEDAHRCMLNLAKKTSLFAVFDGHGGPEVSRYCARILPKLLKRTNSFKNGDIKKALEEVFIGCDKRLIEPKVIKALTKKRKSLGAPCSSDTTPGKHSGTTALVAVIRGNQLFVANAGDSRCVISQQGKAIPLSTDHNFQVENERRRVQENGGEFTGNGHIWVPALCETSINPTYMINLTRSIGDHYFKENPNLSLENQMVTAYPEVTTYLLRSDIDEFMVLACDGIWNSMNDQQVVDFIRARIRTRHLSSICGEMFDEILSPTPGKVGCDNMTCIIIKFKNI